VDGDAHQSRHETDVPDKVADPFRASPLDSHEENAERSAGLAGQYLEVEKRVGRREGKMALQLEAHHASEICPGDGRQFHGFRDDGTPGKSDLRASGVDASLEELTPDGGGRVFVGRHAEGSHEALSAEVTSESDDVHLTVPERDPDDVPPDRHGHPWVHCFGPRSGRSEGAAGVAVTGRGASDQRKMSGTASTLPLSVARR
jgi:hypothetical protein